MTLIFIGDLHGHLVPRADVRNKPQRLVGGLARMYRRIETIRQRSSASVLIHAGNTIQGSAEALFTRRAAQVSVPNQPEFRRGGDESMMTTLDPETASTQSVMDGLQRALANAFVLYANYKRYHWQTFGPSFRDLHLLFDELGAAVMADIDPLGERIRILGGDPVAGADEVQAQAAVEPARIGASMRQVVEQAVANERTVVDGLRATIRAADEAGDPGTSSLLATRLETHEKHGWFLRELLERDGLA